MSVRHTGPWHYEFISERPVGHQWRVADEDDDVVTDFATEEAAGECVRSHNVRLRWNPYNWKYG